MTISSFGDLATAFSLRYRNTEVKQDIQRLGQELSTGITADISDHLGGSYTRLTSVERDLRVLNGFGISISEAQQYTEVLQVRLSQISDENTKFTSDLIASDASHSTATLSTFANKALVLMDSVVGSVNGRSAGRNLFSGDTVHNPAVIPAADILTQLETAITGSATAQDAITAIDTWFSDPLGYDAVAYIGSTTELAPFRMSETVSIGVDVRANDPAIKSTLRALSIVALSTSSAVMLSPDQQNEMLQTAITELAGAQSQIVGVQARVGLAQEQIEGWSIRTQTERSGAEFAKSQLLSVDPYETATRLEAAQFQLESLYTVTARLSQLSLVNFIR